MKGHLVAALAHAPVSIFELSCVIEIFGRQRPELDVPWYDFAIGAMLPGSVRSIGGIDLHVAHGVELFARADTIVIPSWDSEATPSAELLECLVAAKARGARLLSICSGAFLLAEAGLLEGRRAATHWLYADALQRRHPGVHVDADVLYVDDGEIITAAGSAAGLDMLLHLVRNDHGAAVCNIVARRLNIPPHREGGQSQFALRPVPSVKDSRLVDVIGWMREHSTTELAIEELAQRAAMSPRTFFRRFREATGQTPYDWLITERVAVAKELLESNKMSVDQVAFHAGFSRPETLRLHFRRLAGCTPSDYRRHFGLRESRTITAVAAE